MPIRCRGCGLPATDAATKRSAYALAMLAFSPSITIVTNGQSPVWDGPYETFVAEYGVSVRVEAVRGAVDRGCRHADDS